jgi:hypothetical protein
MGGLEGCDGCSKRAATLSGAGWTLLASRGASWHSGDHGSVTVAPHRDRRGAAVARLRTLAAGFNGCSGSRLGVRFGALYASQAGLWRARLL